MKPGMLRRYMAAAPAPPAAATVGRGYPGSKGQAGTWQRIIGQIPPHPVYVEPFFGSGQVFHRKRRAANNIIMDTDARCLAKFKHEITPGVPVAAGAGVRAIVGDAIKALPELLLWLPAETVIYCDPPYLLETRQGRRYYENELSAEQHATLLAVLLQARCRVLISGYPHELYSSQLRAWRCLEYDAMTRGGKRRECLWLNYDEPDELHDWRFAGFNYRQRFTLKRFVIRWLDRIDRMPARRRGYVMHELAAAIEQRHGRSARSEWDLVTPPLAMTAAAVQNATRGVGGSRF